MKQSPEINAFSPELLHPRYWLTWLGLALSWVLAWLPWQVRHCLGQRIGDLMFHKSHKRRNIVLTNLQLCFPELSISEREQLAKRTLQEYTCALLGYSILFFRSRSWLYQQVTIDGREHLDNALKNDSKIILLLGHSAWLEFAPLAIGEDYCSYGSYKPFKNAVLNWMIASSRLKDVEFVVSRDEGMVKLVRSLEPGRMLFFLPDEDHGAKHSTFAPFFGSPKATLTTPARIAKLSRAQCFPVMAFFDAQTGKYRIKVGQELPCFGTQAASQDAALMNQGFQALISEHPEQYMWQLKLFRTVEAGKTQPY